MGLTGPLTPRQALRTFADIDSPDLAAGGLTLALTDVDNAIRYRGPLTLAAFAGANYGLPTAPVDGDMVSLIVDPTNGVEWLLRYVAAEPTYKWRAIYGAPLYSEVAASETTASNAYVALTTPGPAIALPRIGDYDVEIGAAIDNTAGGGIAGLMSYDIGGAAALDADSIRLGNPAGGVGEIVASLARKRRKTALTAVTLTGKYRITAGGAPDAWFNRYMAVSPVRIG
jgi:hypothetical protein